jgi:hypothetical protein
MRRQMAADEHPDRVLGPGLPQLDGVGLTVIAAGEDRMLHAGTVAGAPDANTCSPR